VELKKDKEEFDALLDSTHELDKCCALVAAGGGVTSIVAAPTDTTLLRWVAHSDAEPYCCLPQIIGACGCAVNWIVGASKYRKRCRARGADFDHIITLPASEVTERLAVELRKGTIRPIIDKIFPLSDGVAAVKYLEAGRATGKVVVQVIAELPDKASSSSGSGSSGSSLSGSSGSSLSSSGGSSLSSSGGSASS